MMPIFSVPLSMRLSAVELASLSLAFSNHARRRKRKYWDIQSSRERLYFTGETDKNGIKYLCGKARP